MQRRMFFDNLSVQHRTGPVTEETHYYPFGLTMAGISSKAMKPSTNCGCGIKKGFNGNELQQKEFSDGNGLEMYDFNARTYDQQIGRFLQIDPIPNEGGQESLSVYHYGSNDPIRYNDPDGKCPWCIGAIIGAAVDYATQVAANRLEGKSWKESLTQVDGKSIIISAGAGALSGGLSTIVPKGVTGKILVEGAQVAIDAGESALKQYNETGTVSLKQTITDVVTNKVAGELTKGVEVHSNSAIKTTEKQLDRAERVAAGDPTSSGRAAKVDKLEKKLSEQKGVNQAASQAASGLTSSAIQSVGNTLKGKPQMSAPINYNQSDNTALKKFYIPELRLQ